MLMTDIEWTVLHDLSALNDLSRQQNKTLSEILAKTDKELEHPDWFEGACHCRICLKSR